MAEPAPTKYCATSSGCDVGTPKTLTPNSDPQLEEWHDRLDSFTLPPTLPGLRCASARKAGTWTGHWPLDCFPFVGFITQVCFCSIACELYESFPKHFVNESETLDWSSPTIVPVSELCRSGDNAQSRRWRFGIRLGRGAEDAQHVRISEGLASVRCGKSGCCRWLWSGHGCLFCHTGACAPVFLQGGPALRQTFSELFLTGNVSMKEPIAALMEVVSRAGFGSRNPVPPPEA